MKYFTYLKERGTWAAVFIWLLFSIETFMMTVQGSLWLMVYIAVSLTAAYVGLTYWDYRHIRLYMADMQQTTEELDHKYLLPEVVRQGKRQEEKLLAELIRVVGKDMHEHVLTYKREEQEYKEYIEMWIHEVKVPIAAAKMMIGNHGTEVPEGLMEEVERIEQYTEQALFYARSNDVEKDYFIKEQPLSDIVEDVVLQNKRRFLDMHAVIKLENLDMKIYSDGKWLSFILNQIVENSIKYAGWEPLILKAYGEETHSCVLLHVVDNGVGIPDGEVDRVFDKGFTGSNGRKFRKSTGLGLYLCKKLCGRLGHGLELQSEEGRGCHVILAFPTSEYSRLTKM